MNKNEAILLMINHGVVFDLIYGKPEKLIHYVSYEDGKFISKSNNIIDISKYDKFQLNDSYITNIKKYYWKYNGCNQIIIKDINNDACSVVNYNNYNIKTEYFLNNFKRGDLIYNNSFTIQELQDKVYDLENKINEYENILIETAKLLQ